MLPISATTSPVGAISWNARSTIPTGLLPGFVHVGQGRPRIGQLPRSVSRLASSAPMWGYGMAMPTLPKPSSCNSTPTRTSRTWWTNHPAPDPVRHDDAARYAVGHPGQRAIMGTSSGRPTETTNPAVSQAGGSRQHGDFMREVVIRRTTHFGAAGSFRLVGGGYSPSSTPVGSAGQSRRQSRGQPAPKWPQIWPAGRHPSGSKGVNCRRF